MRFIHDEDLSWQPEVIPQNERWEPVALTAGDRTVALMVGLAPDEDPQAVMRLIEQARAQGTTAKRTGNLPRGLHAD